MIPRLSLSTPTLDPDAYQLVDSRDQNELSQNPMGVSDEATVVKARSGSDGQPSNARQASTNVTRQVRFILSIWWSEIGCCVLIFVTLAATVITMCVSEGEPLPRFPYKISLNTLVAIYIFVMKACILLIMSNGLGQLK